MNNRLSLGIEAAMATMRAATLMLFPVWRAHFQMAIRAMFVLNMGSNGACLSNVNGFPSRFSSTGSNGTSVGMAPASASLTSRSICSAGTPSASGFSASRRRTASSAASFTVPGDSRMANGQDPELLWLEDVAMVALRHGWPILVAGFVLYILASKGC